MRNALQRTWLILLSATLLLVYSCKKDDDPTPEVIAGFSFEVSMDDFKKVTFTNTSQNYDAVSWNFGDNTALSSDVNPVHTYTQEGNYTVTLTATKGSDTDVVSQQVSVANTSVDLGILAGTSSKSWKLLRTVSVGRWPLEVGPLTDLLYGGPLEETMTISSSAHVP